MEPDTDSFIDSIHSHVCLWDTEDDSYNDMPTRDAAWAQIIEKHNIKDVVTAKRRWKKLRDIHREVFKRHRAGRPGKHLKPWKYYSQMQFIIPHITARQKHGIDYQTATQSDNDTADEDEKPKKLKIETAKCRRRTASVIECKPEIISESEDEPATVEADQSYFYGQAHKTPHDVIIDGGDLDPLAKFFGAMYDSAKRLPELYQLEIKRKLFNAVSDAEELFLKSQG